MKYRVERAGRIYELDVQLADGACLVRAPDGSVTRIALEALPDGRRRALTPWGELEVQSARQPGELWAEIGGRRLHARVERVRPASGRDGAREGPGVVCAPMAGKLLRVTVQLGERVSAGQLLAVIEAMKMENSLTSPVTGVVSEIAVQAPSPLDKGALILKVEAS